MHQIIDFRWDYIELAKKYIPSMKWFDNTLKEVQRIELSGFKFNIVSSKEKNCPGYYSGKIYKECPTKTRLEAFDTQCLLCSKLEGFKSAFFFGEEPNAEIRKYLSQRHYLYLAYFEPGILKIGTTSFARRFIRPIEQDALIYCFIAESDGFNIQKIESHISRNFNITESVKASHKLRYLNRKPNYDFALKYINQTIDRIFAKLNYETLQDLDAQLFDRNNIEIVNLSENPAIYYPNTFSFNKSELILFGDFLGLRGRYLFIKCEQGVYTFDTRFLIGRTIKYTSGHNYLGSITENLGLF